jgi:hypothetical protein
MDRIATEEGGDMDWLSYLLNVRSSAKSKRDGLWGPYSESEWARADFYDEMILERQQRDC